ncbi:MAG TPA: chorismate mutase [Geminicoccaceae bacterium]|nr:chorismate mutase [Geminicoccaceae bacterium]
MESAEPPLEDLRRAIDRIDGAILDLLIERTDVVCAIGEVKGDRVDGRLAMRPAREAVILRRLVAQAGDRFPRRVLVRMWRELLAATTRQQTPVSVAVHAPKEDPAVWDLARDHFGSTTPTVRSESVGQAIRAVSDGAATIAVLPLPRDDESWWLALISGKPDRLRVFGRLPFVAGRSGDGEEPRALALGQLEPEPSGDDLTLLAIEADPGISRVRLRALMEASDLAPEWQVTWRPADPGQAVHLVEVGDLVREDDQRLAALLAAAPAEVLRIVAVGGYPRPLPPD